MSRKKTARLRPRVIANFAVTADGKITTRNRTPTGFTSDRDKRRLLEIRALGDAVMVGRGTLEADQMSMGMPDAELRRQRAARGQQEFPLRVIVSNSGRLDPAHKVFHSPGGRIVVFASNRMPAAVRSGLQQLAGITLHCSQGTPDLGRLLQCLRRDHGVATLVCEGGAALFRSLCAIDAVDELYLTIAPLLFGGENAPTLTGAGEEFFKHPLEFEVVEQFTDGNECYLRHVRAGRRTV